MARFNGKDLTVKVENSSSSEVAFTYVYEVDVNFEYEEVEFEGENRKSSQAGPLTSEVVVRYEHDSTATTGNNAVLEGIDGDNTNPRFVRVRPIGDTVGNPEFAMDSVLLKYGPTGVQRSGRLVGEAVFKCHTEASAAPAWGTVSA